MLGVPLSPVALPEKVVAVTTPVKVPSPVTVKAEEAVVVPTPTFVVVLIPVSLDANFPPATPVNSLPSPTKLVAVIIPDA